MRGHGCEQCAEQTSLGVARCWQACLARRGESGQPCKFGARPGNRRSGCLLYSFQSPERPLSLTLQAVLAGIWEVVSRRCRPLLRGVWRPTSAKYPSLAVLLLGGVGATVELREMGSQHQAVASAGAVHKATRVDAPGQEPSEHQVVANGKAGEVRGDVRATAAVRRLAFGSAGLSTRSPDLSPPALCPGSDRHSTPHRRTGWRRSAYLERSRR